MTVVKQLSHAKNPSSTRLVRPFSAVVAKHILRDKEAVAQTASKVDAEFGPDGAVRSSTDVKCHHPC